MNSTGFTEYLIGVLCGALGCFRLAYCMGRDAGRADRLAADRARDTAGRLARREVYQAVEAGYRHHN